MEGRAKSLESSCSDFDQAEGELIMSGYKETMLHILPVSDCIIDVGLRSIVLSFLPTRLMAFLSYVWKRHYTPKCQHRLF